MYLLVAIPSAIKHYQISWVLVPWSFILQVFPASTCKEAVIFLCLHLYAGKALLPLLNNEKKIFHPSFLSSSDIALCLYFSVKHEVKMSVARAGRVISCKRMCNVNGLTTILLGHRMTLTKEARCSQYSKRWTAINKYNK